MNEIILIGEVSSRIIESKRNKTTTVYLKIKDMIDDKSLFIPVCFKCMKHDLFFLLKGKEIAISGHIEPSLFNRIFVDVIQIL